MRDLLHGGGELQAQLDDPALGGGEVAGSARRSPANTHRSLKVLPGPGLAVPTHTLLRSRAATCPARPTASWQLRSAPPRRSGTGWTAGGKSCCGRRGSFCAEPRRRSGCGAPLSSSPPQPSGCPTPRRSSVEKASRVRDYVSHQPVVRKQEYNRRPRSWNSSAPTCTCE